MEFEVEHYIAANHPRLEICTREQVKWLDRNQPNISHYTFNRYKVGDRYNKYYVDLAVPVGYPVDQYIYNSYTSGTIIAICKSDIDKLPSDFPRYLDVTGLDGEWIFEPWGSSIIKMANVQSEMGNGQVISVATDYRTTVTAYHNQIRYRDREGNDTNIRMKRLKYNEQFNHVTD